MAPNANPLNSDGVRNVYCPHYRGCLDHACKLYWDFMSCDQCAYRNTSEPPRLEQFVFSYNDDGAEGYRCDYTSIGS